MLLSLFVPLAAAQDVETFALSSSAFEGTRGLQLETPEIGWEGAISAGLGVVYAHGQLVQVNADGSETPIISDSFATRLSGAYTLLGRARIGLELPLYPYVGGAADDPGNGVSAGDLRLRGVVPLPLGESFPVDLAIVPMLGLPTGEAKAYMGAGGVSGGLAVAAGYTLTDLGPVSQLDLTGNLGFRAMPSSTLGDQPLGSAIDFGLGAAWPVREDITVGLELDGVIDLAGGLSPWTDNPWEVHAYGRYGKNSGIQALFGLGTGLVGGVGAPDIRIVGGVGYRLPGKEPVYDVDGDGIFDDVDACVTEPEDLDQFEDSDGCPDLDDDRDGVPDTADRCKSEPEDADGFEDADGCPDPDNDKDGVLDASDACPDVAGTAAARGCPDRDGDTVVDTEDACPDEAGSPENLGCPDRDNDKVPDSRDKCPDQPIDAREDPARSDGCPKRVFVSASRIEILDKVFFETNKATIKTQSYGLLADVARVLNENPDIQRVEVAGHTDSVGNDAANLKLSQGRADAVVQHLTRTGKVARERLGGVGYGETQPLDTNATEPGRATNRRVEFVIKSMAPRSEAPVPVRVATPPAPAPAPAAPAPAADPWSPPPAPTPAPTPAPPKPAPTPDAPINESKPAEKAGGSDDPFGLDGE